VHGKKFMSKGAKDRGSVQAEPAVEESSETGQRIVWNFGFNDFVEELPADKLKDFKPTGTFAADFSALSARCGVMLHPGFAPPARNKKKQIVQRGRVKLRAQDRC
jgi:hypothetical protein